MLLLTDYKIDVHGILLVADLARVVGYGLPINLYSLCCMIKEFILFFYSLLYLFKVYFILMDKTDLKVLKVLMWNFILKYFIINYLIKSYLFSEYLLLLLEYWHQACFKTFWNHTDDEIWYLISNWFIYYYINVYFWGTRHKALVSWLSVTLVSWLCHACFVT